MISRRQALVGVGATVSALSLSTSPVLSSGISAGRATKIVSVGGAITETLFALKLGDRIRAVDTTSTYPDAAKALPKVGYLRELSAEGVLAMQPDLVLLSAEAGPPAAIAQLKAAGIPVQQIAIGRTPDGVRSMVEAIGQATGTQNSAAELAAQIGAGFDSLAAALPAEQTTRVLLLLSAGAGPLLGAGANTAAASIIALGGGQLAFPEMDGYKAVSLEPVLAADPDWLLFPSHVAMALGGADGIAALDVVSKTRAGQAGRVAFVDSHYLLGFGPRAPQAAADLATLFYPDITIPTIGRDAVPSSLLGLMGKQ
ncbi:MAG: ABC transporter substrate-binding protein [Alphaproteobacteria bacterium]|nr:ABC transporter substrate-binding protein [Alphaproteobacteria bacterium]MBO6627718.1 ABC transporter substrate-binding protein [Alphaproteobacteria bacterium]MDF1627500.1 ABC transporter substrate-binding protein [Parvibaculaceae bacterium]